MGRVQCVQNPPKFATFTPELTQPHQTTTATENSSLCQAFIGGGGLVRVARDLSAGNSVGRDAAIGCAGSIPAGHPMAVPPNRTRLTLDV